MGLIVLERQFLYGRLSPLLSPFPSVCDRQRSGLRTVTRLPIETLYGKIGWSTRVVVDRVDEKISVLSDVPCSRGSPYFLSASANNQSRLFFASAPPLPSSFSSSLPPSTLFLSPLALLLLFVLPWCLLIVPFLRGDRIEPSAARLSAASPAVNKSEGPYSVETGAHCHVPGAVPLSPPFR